MVTNSNNGGRFSGGFRMRPEDMANFKRGMEEALREKYGDRFAGMYYDSFDDINTETPHMREQREDVKTDPKTGRKFRNLNHPIPKRDEPMRNKVVIHQAAPEHYQQGTYHVTLPRRGRLGDIRLCDESGRPCNIGPTYRGPSEFGKVDDALNHFRRVARAFDRLNGYGVDP